ncbi:MAG: alpha-2-macroglobulin family protein [Kofleriaceae bacterium]
MRSKASWLLAVHVLAACVPDRPPPGGPRAPELDPGPPVFAHLVPAPPGTALRVFVDRDRIVGWLAGSVGGADQPATLVTGDVTTAARLDDDNTFTFPYRVTKPTDATVTVGSHVERITLRPRENDSPAAYIVVDRTAYRPGQKLGFAAFLRKPERDTFVPVAHAKVEVRVISETKQTVAAKLALTADATGRIAGEYTFSAGDPLDGYTISIPGYAGTARVVLAEYRKSKIKLEVDAKIANRHAMLAFRALDFLDHAVPGGSVAFTAQVVRDTAPEKLLSADFAFGSAPAPLGRDQRLVFAADARAAPDARLAQVVASELTGKVTLDARGAGSHRLPIKSEWLRGHHKLLVDATIVDANGREQRTTRAIPLERRDVRVELAAPHELVAAGEPTAIVVRVVDADGKRVAATTSVTALRVASTASSDWGFDSYNANGSWGSSLYDQSCEHTSSGCWGRRRPAFVQESAETLAGTSAVVAERANLTLDDPGAYRLVASAKLADGSTIWSELGVAVREAEDLAQLVLELDRDEVRHGERITGRLHSRYRDAHVLVVARDANGIAVRQRLALVGGRAAIDLPSGTLGYGAAVEAYVLGTGSHVEAAQQLVHVIPTSKMLSITTSAEPTTDRAIGSTSRSRSTAPRRWISWSASSIRRCSGSRPIGQRRRSASFMPTIACTRAPRWPRCAPSWRRHDRRACRARARVANPDPATTQLVQLVIGAEQGSLSMAHLVALLRFAGVSTGTSGYPSWYVHLAPRLLAKQRLIDLLETEGRQMTLTRVADRVLIGEPSAPALAWSSSRAVARGDSHFSVTGNATFSAPASLDLPTPLDVDGGPADVVRRDFSDSALWNARIRTGPDGKARVSFVLPDSLTNWHVVVTAVARDLAVGRHVGKLRTVRDVMVWPMIPRQFTQGDTVDVFASVHNLTDADRDIVVSLRSQNADVRSPAQVTVRVPHGGNVPVTWSVRAREPGLASLVMTATSGTLADASLKRIPVLASSTEQVVTASGFTDRPLTLALPAGVDPRTATLEVTFAPSLAADLVQTLDYLVEYPYGCAEQTMSRFTPAIRVAGILENLGIRDSALAARLPAVVELGVKRLIDMQQPDGGWGWQSGSETHEMMTPYVLWGLLEAERAGYKLSSERAIERGLARVRRFLETTGPAQLSDRTYLLYVYSQREKLPEAWWSGLVHDRDKLSDYGLALALEMALARKDRPTAELLVTRLRERALRSGGGARWRTAGFSRWGDDPFEITAVVLKALVAHDANDPLIPEVIAYFVATKRGDRWNSTKDTAMVLFAMTEYLGKRGIKAVGRNARVEYTIDGGPATKLAFADGLVRKITVGKPSALTTIAFPTASPGMMAHAVLKFRRTGRDLRPVAQGLDVTRQLFLLGPKGARTRELQTGARIPKGAYVESVVSVTHTAGEAMRYLLVADPRPAGAEALPVDDPRFPTIPPTWSLREDRETGMAYHHESLGTSTTTRTILHLEMAGDLAIPPAQAELLYQTETRGSSGSLVVRVE